MLLVLISQFLLQDLGIKQLLVQLILISNQHFVQPRHKKIDLNYANIHLELQLQNVQMQHAQIFLHLLVKEIVIITYLAVCSIKINVMVAQLVLVVIVLILLRHLLIQGCKQQKRQHNVNYFTTLVKQYIVHMINIKQEGLQLLVLLVLLVILIQCLQLLLIGQHIVQAKLI